MVTPVLKKGDALLLVDVQYDFCPGGALEVPNGDSIIPTLNQWIEGARNADIPVIASRDWHPVEHVSFADQGGPWPDHCIQDTRGAQFHADLKLPDETVRVSKGTAFDQDAYSAFDGTGLNDYLNRHGVRRLWVGGLAEDVCVLETVKDGAKAGFDTHLIADGTRPVEPGKLEATHQEMEEAGVVLEETNG